MRLRALRLWNVRCFGGRGIAIEGISDGVNVLSAANEQGKSTCFDALHALFFQPSSGTPKAVRLLRPYSGGSVRIEADVETDGGLFRITKQFYAGSQTTVTDLKTGRLVAQADSAEAWISALVRGGASGPAGLLWVRQGITEMGAGTRSERNEELRAREDVLTSVAGEVEALTGGRRMARILNRCDEDLAGLVTATGRPVTGGPYTEVIGEREVLVAEEGRLAADLKILREALASRRQKRARLSELEDPAQAESRRKDKSDAEAALENAKLHASKLAAAEAHAALARKQHETAADALANYDDALAKAVKLGEALRKSGGVCKTAKLALETALQADKDAAGNLDTAETKDRAVRQELARANRAREAARADEQVGELEARLTSAENETQKAETARAESAALAVPEKLLAKLEELERQIAALQAAEEAAAATLRIDYEQAASGQVRRAGVPLADRETVAVTETIELEIETVGLMTVTPGQGSGEAARTKRRTAEEASAGLLTELGSENLVAARARARQADARANDARIAQAAATAAAPEGIETLRANLQRLKELTHSLDPKAPSVTEAEAAATDAADKLTRARAAREKTRAHFDAAKEGHLRAEGEWTAVRTALDQIDQDLGPTETRQTERLSRAKAACDTKRDLAQVNEDAGTLRVDAPDLKTVQAMADRAASRVERARKEIEALGLDLAGLDATIYAKASDAVEEEFEEVRGRLEAAEKRIGHFESEVAALNRLKQALEDSRSAAKELYFGPVMAELRPLLSLLFEEASITFDETTLLPLSLERAGQNEAIDVLSGGMREQLSVLTRLAFARLLARDGRPVPVILDDALVYSDDDRIERMFDALHRQATDLQIVVFTCRQRAFERLGGDPLQMVDWRPDAL